MLLEFKVKNFRSIKDWQSFSMLAESKVKEHSEAVIEQSGYNFLPSAIIYGRNASGKSNLLQAIEVLKLLTLNSGEMNEGDLIPFYNTFKLSSGNSGSSVEFLIDFLASDGLRYIYSVGFSSSEITYEKLIFYPKTKPAILFSRVKNQKIIYGEYLTGKKKGIEELLYPNQLFLSKVGTERNDQLSIPFSFFKYGLLLFTVHGTSFDEGLSRQVFNALSSDKGDKYSDNFNKLLQFADTGISTIKVKRKQIDESMLPENIDPTIRKKLTSEYSYKVKTLHKVFEDNEFLREVEFDLEDESTGTKKLLTVGGKILSVLAVGGVLVVDELDKSLHPRLTRALIKLFNSKKKNPNNAQLIFATHDVSLLDAALFRRDQVWFAEKEQEGYSHYYALSDIPGVRANTPYEKWYISGRFGATPSINEHELDFEF